MNPLDIANSGQMPINGGHASASNGDTMFDANGAFGGINHKNGVSPWLLAGLAVAGIVAYVVINRA